MCVQMLISIETHITCDFPGGIQTPYSSSGSAHARLWDQALWKCMYNIINQKIILISLPPGKFSPPPLFLSSVEFFKISFLKKKIRNAISVKQFGSRSKRWAWFGSELFAKVISRRHLEIKSLVTCWLKLLSHIGNQPHMKHYVHRITSILHL